jgi:predicted hydrocarbon binding protein
VDSPEQVRYCLERTLRIDPDSARARRGMEWLNARQAEIDEARAAAERVKPYWQTSKPKPLLNLVKKQHAASANAMSTSTATGDTHSARPIASWTAISATIPGTRTARANLPTMPVSPATLDRIAGVSSPVKDPIYRDEVLDVDDDLAPRFVTNIALHHLWKSVEKVTGEAGLQTMLEGSGLAELNGYFPDADESLAINFTRFSAFTEAMEEFYGSAVEAMQVNVGREMLRQELALKDKLASSKGITFKLMSAEKKLQTILMELADAHARMGMETYFEEQKGGYLFVIETCPYCFGRLTNARCNVTAGFLAAGIEWATGLKLQIDETSCRGLDEPHCAYWIAY